MDWQPIKTAPPRTRVLICDDAKRVQIGRAAGRRRIASCTLGEGVEVAHGGRNLEGPKPPPQEPSEEASRRLPVLQLVAEAPEP